jgi:hypothetical protein
MCRRANRIHVKQQKSRQDVMTLGPIDRTSTKLVQVAYHFEKSAGGPDGNISSDGLKMSLFRRMKPGKTTFGSGKFRAPF